MEDKRGRLNIQLDKDYWITSDNMNYTLGTKHINSEGEESFRPYGYYNKLEYLLKSYKELKIRTKNISTIDELLNYVEKMDKQIEKILGGI